MALDSNIPLFALRSMQSNQIGPEGVMKGYQGTQDLIAKQRMSKIAQQGLPFQEQYKQQLQALSGADPVAAMKLQAGQEAMRQKQAYAQYLADQKRNTIGPIEEAKQLAIQYRNQISAMASDNWNNLGGDAQDQIKATIQSTRNRLLQLGPFGKSLIGQVEQEVQSGQEVQNAQGEQDPLVSEQGIVDGEDPFKTIKQDPFKTIKQDLSENSKDDNPRDGYIDSIVSLSDKVNRAIIDSKLGTADPYVKSLRAYMEELKNNVKLKYNESENKRKEQKADIERKKERDLKYSEHIQTLVSKNQKSYNIGMGIKKNPRSNTRLLEGLNIILRDESGAAIAGTEYLGRLQTLLGDNDTAFESLKNEITGLKGFVYNKILPSTLYDTNILLKFIRYIDKDKLVDELTQGGFSEEGLSKALDAAAKRQQQKLHGGANNSTSNSNIKVVPNEDINSVLDGL